MKPALQLKMGHQLTMTPQLQQAIRILQLSTLDLQQEIQEALETNPMLEQVEVGDPDYDSGELDADGTGNGQDEPAAESLDNTENEPPSSSKQESESSESDWQQDHLPDDLPVDSGWDDVYPGAETFSGGSAGGEDYDYLETHQTTESLQDHLSWQLNLASMSDTDRAIAMAIVDGIDPDGYLRVPIEEIVEGFQEDSDVGEEEVIAVLRRIQSFDPAGVGARDLRECMQLQLNQLPEDTPGLARAKEIVDSHLDALANRDYNRIMQRMKMREEELRTLMQLLRSLSPRPGAQISAQRPEYVVPDVVVSKREGRWQVELNSEAAPRLRINSTYANMIRRADSSSDNVYMRNQLQEARWFLRSLLSRNETLLKVATRIVEHQRGFLEYGEEAMRPLVLHDIAEAVEMHESTISRVTTQKYMHTPRGVYELKYFFSSHVSTEGGGECSSTAIRAIIKKLVAAEDCRKPLSDSKIANMLGEQGIQVARRTIAKYRESLKIPPSNERRQLV